MRWGIIVVSTGSGKTIIKYSWGQNISSSDTSSKIFDHSLTIINLRNQVAIGSSSVNDKTYRRTIKVFGSLKILVLWHQRP